MMCCGHPHEQLNGDFDFFDNGIASNPGAGLFVHLDMVGVTLWTCILLACSSRLYTGLSC